ncbi:MAG: hypothetical protein ACREQV_20600 [Candidatus Binatia bacterium]
MPAQRALRLLRNDRKFAIEFIKGPYLDLGKDRDKYAERVYDAAVAYYYPRALWMRNCSAR